MILDTVHYIHKQGSTKPSSDHAVRRDVGGDDRWLRVVGILRQTE